MTSSLSVVGIRGTSSLKEVFVDVQMLHDVVFVQLIPLLFVMPPALPKLLNNILQLPLWFIQPNASSSYSTLMHPLLRHLDALSNEEGRSVVLTGHSLGGFLSTLMGLKYQSPSAAFAGSMAGFGGARFDMKSNIVSVERRTSLNVRAENDLVPWVGSLFNHGTVTNIECKQRFQLACHSASHYVCELAKRCGAKKPWHDTPCKDHI